MSFSNLYTAVIIGLADKDNVKKTIEIADYLQS